MSKRWIKHTTSFQISLIILYSCTSTYNHLTLITAKWSIVDEKLSGRLQAKQHVGVLIAAVQTRQLLNAHKSTTSNKRDSIYSVVRLHMHWDGAPLNVVLLSNDLMKMQTQRPA